MRSTYEHAKCGKRVPNSAYHCAGCHETFVGLTAFDRHRRQDGGSGMCVIDPVSADPFVDSGFWADDNGLWHSGRRLTEAERQAIFGRAS